MLTETLEPRTGETIDCRGGSITAAVPAAENNGISEPDTLILLEDVRRVRITNCTLEATFAIFAVRGGSHRITGNTIRSTAAGVTLLSSDANLVDHNEASGGGRNFQITGDSDANVVWANDITNADGPAAQGWPGGVFPTEPEAVGAGTYNYPGVLNLVVNGRLVQDGTTTDTYADHTTFLGNDIHMNGGLAGTILATRSRNALAMGNDVSGMELGIAIFGYDDGTAWSNPGRCSADPSLLCGAWGPVDPSGDLADTCDLPVVGDQGVCQGWSIVQGGGRVRSPSFVGNHVSGTEAGASGGWSADYRFLANDIENNDIGVWFDGYAIEDGTFRGNVVRGNALGLLLADLDFALVAEANADIAYNDFGDNDVVFHAVRVEFGPPPDYPETLLPFVLEMNLPDNWWGDACGIAASEMWPNTTAEPAAAEPIAMAWRRGLADGVPRCP